MSSSYEVDELTINLAEEYARMIVCGQIDEQREAYIRRFLSIGERESTKAKAYVEEQQELTATVGIWKPEERDEVVYYVKDKTKAHEHKYWANVKEISPKLSCRRVAFLGESVARGFLYDPYYTPASLLKHLLNDNDASQNYEVIDLAKVSIGIEELETLCRTCVALDPDVVVVFAGNNWRKSLYPLSEDEVQAYRNAYRSAERFDIMEGVLNGKLEQKISSLMKALHESTYERNIPVIILVPEFNLLNWKVSNTERALTWDLGTTGVWVALKEEAEQALLDTRYADAEIASLQMLEMNKVNPLPYELLAKTRLGCGDLQGARTYLERQRDTCIFREGPPPTCSTFIQSTLKRQAEIYGFQVIDLPSIFRDASQGGIPGHNLFIDYCHLSIEGIQLSIQHTARATLAVLNNRAIEAADLRMSAYYASDDVAAQAHFYAAIHSAHLEQPYEVLLYHCREAIRLSRKIEGHFRSYINLATKKVPWEFNKSYESLMNQQYSILRQKNECKLLDILLVDAMLEALAGVGVELAEAVDEARIKQHKPLSNRKLNLLETYYREMSYFSVMAASSLLGCDTTKAYYSSRDYKSNFYVITDQQDEVNVDMTFRTAVDQDEALPVFIYLNDRLIYETAPSQHWKSIQFKLPGEMLRKHGKNVLTIRWPFIDHCEQRVRQVYTRKYSGNELIGNLGKPVYADISLLNASLDVD